MAAGHAVRQALTLSFSKGGEERRTCVAVISIQRKSEKQLSSKASAAFRLPAITSIRSLVFPAQAVIPRSIRDEAWPRSEAVLRRCDLGIVCETPMASDKLHSPSPETARRQSIPVGHPPEMTERKWQARAAASIRERRNARSPADDEFVHHSPKVPPDKSRKSETNDEV